MNIKNYRDFINESTNISFEDWYENNYDVDEIEDYGEKFFLDSISALNFNSKKVGQSPREFIKFINSNKLDIKEIAEYNDLSANMDIDKVIRYHIQNKSKNSNFIIDCLTRIKGLLENYG
jgi:hypothetical protein